jgi:hypothetical protein
MLPLLKSTVLGGYAQMRDDLGFVDRVAAAAFIEYWADGKQQHKLKEVVDSNGRSLYAVGLKAFTNMVDNFTITDDDGGITINDLPEILDWQRGFKTEVTNHKGDIAAHFAVVPDQLDELTLKAIAILSESPAG